MMSPGSPASGAGRSASGSRGTVRPAVRRWVRAACLTRVTIQGSRFSSGREKNRWACWTHWSQAVWATSSA